MSSPATEIMSSSSVDLTTYRQNLTAIGALSKGEIMTLQSFDAEQIRLEKKMKDAKVRVNETTKKRAASYTYSKITQESVNYRRHSVPRTSILDRREKRCVSKRQFDSVVEPSISGLSSSTDDEAAVEKIDSESALQKLSTQEKTADPTSLHRVLMPQSSSVVPMSRRRLSIPKRSYSPEPLKRIRPVFGFRKTIETIRLSDLKEKVATMKCEDFCLPRSFNMSGDRKTFLSSADNSVKGAELGSVSNVSNCDCRSHPPISKTASGDVWTSDRKPKTKEETKDKKEADGNKGSKRVALNEKELGEDWGWEKGKEGEKCRGQEKKEGEGNGRDERKSKESQCFANQGFCKARSSAEETFLKRKRGRPRKSMSAQQIEKESVCPSSAPEEHIATTSTANNSFRTNEEITHNDAEGTVSDGSERKNTRSTVKVEEESSVVSRTNSSSSTSAMSDEGQIINAKTGDTAHEKNTDAARLKNSVVDTVKLSIKQEIESPSDSSSPNYAVTSNSRGAGTEMDSKDMEIIGLVVDELITKICDLEEKSKTAFCGLVMEPLRRPQDRRRVPPLRIRLPKRREVRKRIPARSRDYSPPGRTTRPRFSRVSAALHQELFSNGNVISNTRRSRRSRKISNTHDDNVNDVTLVVAERSDILTSPKDPEKDTSATMPSTERVSQSRPEAYKGPPFDEIVDSSLKKGRDLIDEMKTYAATVISSEPSEKVSLSKAAKKVAELVNSYSVKEFPPQITDSKTLPSTGTSLSQNCDDREQCHIRPSRQKKSYQELYPSLFKNRRKRADKSGSSTDKVAVVRETKRRHRSSALSEESISSHPTEVDNSHHKALTVTAGKKPSSLQTKVSKHNRHSTETSQNTKIKLEHPSNTVVKEGQEVAAEFVEVAKEKEQGTQISEPTLHSPKNVASPHISAEVEKKDISVTEPSESVPPREHNSNSTSNSNNGSVVMSSAEPVPKRSSSISISSETKGSKRWKRHIETQVGSSVKVNEVAVNDAKTDVEVIQRKKTRRGSQLRAASTDEKLYSNISVKKLTLPYFKRIAQRRKLNPLAIGLKSRSEDADQKIFYRELLLRGNELRRNDGEEDLDVESYITPVGDDEYGFENPAADVASAVDRILPRPTVSDESGETTEMTVENILENSADAASEKRHVLKEMLSSILAQYTADVTASSICGGASVEYSTMLLNARRLRDRVFTFSEERRANAQWAHKLLIRQLPLPILATYINLLRYCKSVARYLVDILLKEQQDDDLITMANRLIISFMNNKILDPQTTPIAKTLGKRHLDSVCLLAVDPYFAHLEYTPKIKAHEYLFKVLFPSSFGRVEQLRACLPSSVEFSAAEVVEYLVDVVSKRLKELIKKYPSKKVVLAGWGTSCFINHEVVQFVPNVHAILDFAFPLKTVDGMRGDADDTILLTYCPTLFIVGEQATDCDTVEIQKLASKMKALSGVIVVGTANNNLQISPLCSSIERFTQKTVHRALIDDIIDFLEKTCIKNQPDSNLKPVPVAETSNADLSVMRGSTTSSRYIPKSRRQSDGGTGFEPVKKRLCSRDSQESDFGFRRSNLPEATQNEQSLLIPGRFVPQLSTNERNDLILTHVPNRPVVLSAVKCLADETLDNLMSPL